MGERCIGKMQGSHPLYLNDTIMLLQSILCGTFVPPKATKTRVHRILAEPVKKPSPKVTIKPEAKKLPEKLKTTIPVGSERLLSVLDKKEWYSITALASKLGVTSSAIHQFMRPLYDQDLIVRKIVSGKGNIRYRYVKLRCENEKRGIISDVEDRRKAIDSKIVRFISEKWKTRKQICSSVSVTVDVLDQAMRRISKTHKIEKERVRINTIKTMRYRITGQI